jgi:hypothetical protein
MDFADVISHAFQERDHTFFIEISSISIWYCLGEETVGVCKGVPADTTMEGVPVTQDWMTYTVHSLGEYEGRWQETMEQASQIRLHAISHQFGDNPLIPMAAESFQAILSIEGSSTDISDTQVQVLYFEFVDGKWWLQGELIPTENNQAWLDGGCDRCYDEWMAWFY